VWPEMAFCSTFTSNPCELCQQETTALGSCHPYFLYLISLRECTGRMVGLIGSSRHPLERLQEQNRDPEHRKGSKKARPEAGNWRLEMVIGPWKIEKTSVFQLVEQWKQTGKGGLTEQIQAGVQLGLQYPEVNVYVADKAFVTQIIMNLVETTARDQDKKD
jgi:hypothetical protein